MKTYKVKKAYPWSDTGELEITSDDLVYVELGTSHSGCQSASMKNNDNIHKLCKQVAVLIRDIDILNK